MFYSIRHVTRFRYSGPVHESVMELRMQPRSETGQTLRNFQIATNPRAQLYAYTDHFGNAVYHFNVLRQHSELRIDAISVVEVKDQAMEKGNAFLDNVTTMIRANPLKAVAIAFGVGYIGMRIFRR